MWCERQSLCTERKDADRPEAWLPELFSQELRVGRKRFGEKEKIKSLFYEHRKVSWIEFKAGFGRKPAWCKHIGV